MSNDKVGKEVIEHWYGYVEGCHFSSAEFYDSIEDDLRELEVPRLRASRPEFHEGGGLSAKRVYLRLSRERYSFDICAAPFGTGYFFSCRFVERPRTGILKLVLLAIAMVVAFVAAKRLMASTQDLIMAALALVIGIPMLAFIVKKMGSVSGQSASAPADLPDIDAFLLDLPYIGEWYEKRRKDTYHRHDTRLLYHSIVSGLVKRKVDEVTAAKGVRLTKQYEYSPVLGGLYKEKKAPEPATA